MRIPTRRIGSPNACVRHRRAHVCARARAGACEYGRPRNPRRTCERFPSASTASGFGSQAFYRASAFNANIGAWNTAAVTTLISVCAAFGPGSAHTAGVAGRRSAGLRCGAAGCARRHGGCAHAQTYRHSVARAPTCVGMAAERKDSMCACVCIYRYI